MLQACPLPMHPSQQTASHPAACNSCARCIISCDPFSNWDVCDRCKANHRAHSTAAATVRHDRPPRRTRSTALHAIAAAAGTASIPFLVPTTRHHHPPPLQTHAVQSRLWTAAAALSSAALCASARAASTNRICCCCTMASPLAPVTPSCVLFHSRTISPRAVPRWC